MSLTRANEHALRRVVSGQSFGRLVASVTEHELCLRPLGHRRGGVTIPWSAVYLRAVEAMVEAERRAKGKTKRVTRGRRV